jgi:aminopeptidase N
MEAMQADRRNVFDYFKKDTNPIVNTSITDVNKVLSTNTYQKASWVLHMLRNEIGDQKFWDGIRQYYKQYQLGNALTDDFRKVMESASGQDLKAFFDQWIYRGGHPRLAAGWAFDPKKNTLKITIDQKQEQLFSFPLEVAITDSQGNTRVEKFIIQDRKKEFTVPSDAKPAKLALDPNVRLLFEGDLREVGSR